jgi:hypothetical protein
LKVKTRFSKSRRLFFWILPDLGLFDKSHVYLGDEMEVIIPDEIETPSKSSEYVVSRSV